LQNYTRARISRAKFRQILRLFALDLTALQIAKITNLDRNTVNRYLKLTRTLIAAFCEQESPFCGEVQCDESYFNSRYQAGKRGRGAENKHIVFGKAKILQAIIKGKVSFDASLYTDGFRSYDSIVHLGYHLKSFLLQNLIKNDHFAGSKKGFTLRGDYWQAPRAI